MTPSRSAPASLRGDHELTARVRSALMADGALRSRNIHIATLRHCVELLGSVVSGAERERAGAAASSVSGVRSVVNRLAVRTDERGDA